MAVEVAVVSMPDCEVCGNVFCVTPDTTEVLEGCCCWPTFENCVIGDVICDDDAMAAVCIAASVTDADAGAGESLGSMLFDDMTGFCTALNIVVDIWTDPAAAAVGGFIFITGCTAVAVADVTLLGENVVCFCCDGATNDDVICCGGDVTD